MFDTEPRACIDKGNYWVGASFVRQVDDLARTWVLVPLLRIAAAAGKHGMFVGSAMLERSLHDDGFA
jgi:hypothetical protein